MFKEKGKKPTMSWESLALHPKIVDMIKQHHDAPSLVQQHSIPQLLSKKDVLVEACTGSGKTNSFILPCLHFMLNSKDDFGIVIISPTRELSKQTFGILKIYCDKLSLECGLVTSGCEPSYPKTKRYILVATPKRLINAVVSKKVNVKVVQVVICDEADRLVDGTFHIGFSNLLRLFPKQRLTGLYSATLCKDDFFVQQLVRKMGMRNPFVVRIKSSMSSENSSSPSQLQYKLCYVQSFERILALFDILCKESSDRIVIFVNSSDGVTYLTRLFKLLLEIDPDNPLKKRQLPKYFTNWKVAELLKKFNFIGIHGKMKSSKREQVYNQFIKKTDKRQVLISTDLTSRGIDFDQVDLVVQLDPPSDLANIFHRSGRTARYNSHGKSIICLHPTQSAFEFTMEQKQLKWELLKLELTPSINYLQKLNEFDWKLNSLAKASVISLYEAYRNMIYKYIFDLSKLDVSEWCIGCGLLQPVYLKEIKKINIEEYKKTMLKLVN
eukprot:NODE_276_length_12087_cov_0.626376.p3 type:complete len:496 gc:universal NODE_276_length_12087_cov_0.626376:384-1871(+)